MAAHGEKAWPSVGTFDGRHRGGSHGRRQRWTLALAVPAQGRRTEVRSRTVVRENVNESRTLTATMPHVIPEPIAVDLAATNGYPGPHLDLTGAIAEIALPEAALAHGPASGGDAALGWVEPAPTEHPLYEFIAQVAATSATARTSILAPTMLYQTRHGFLLRVVFYTLTLAIADHEDTTVLRWWLEPGGDDATLRADGLALLAALHQPGELVIEAAGEPLFPARRVKTDFHDLAPDIAAERRFLEDLATLEEWSGSRIPVPDEADSAKTTEVARLVAILRARQLPLRLDPRFEVTTTMPLQPGETAAFRLPLSLLGRPLGVAIPMGNAVLELDARVATVEPTPRGTFRSTCDLPGGRSLHTSLHFEPPESRLRVLRRTLVAGAPRPPMTPMVVDHVMDARERFETDDALAWAEREFGPLPGGLVDEMEQWWRA